MARAAGACHCFEPVLFKTYRNAEGAGLKKLQPVPVGSLSASSKSRGISMLGTGVIAVLVPANRNTEGAGLKQFQPVPIGHLSVPSEYRGFSMLGTGVIAV